MAERALGSDVPAEADVTTAIDRLMHQDHYTPQELAELLDMPLSLINHEAFAGRLKADIVEHDILCIRREDVITWLNERT